MSSSAHVDSKKKDILIFGKGPRQELDDATLTAEKKYLIDFTESRKKLCLSLQNNGVKSYLVVNGIGFINLKQRILKSMQFHYV